MRRGLAYLDTSAAAKLVLDEEHSPALRRWLTTWPVLLSSELLAIELTRAVRREVPNGIALVDRALAGIALTPIGDEVVVLSGLIEPGSLKTLDAIHLATAVLARDAIGCFVSYDRRLAEAARGIGLPVAAPV